MSEAGEKLLASAEEALRLSEGNFDTMSVGLNGLRIDLEKGDTGLIYATSPDVPGLLVTKDNVPGLLAAIPGVVAELEELRAAPMKPTIEQMAAAVERICDDEDNMADYYEHGNGDMVLANEYRASAATLRAAADALLAMEWRPIESAPHGEQGNPETHFLGCKIDPVNKRLISATCYRNGQGAYEWWGGGISPTHWKPLTPPTDGEGE